MKAVSYTIFALVCFAFNSIFCRLALGTNSIDAASFTTVRLVSGATMLFFIFLLFGGKESITKQGNWLSSFFLFGYAICFSFAYINLTTGMGALILFGSVQATMIAAALAAGERPNFKEWIGLAVALGGLFYLVFPGLGSPPFFSSLMMALAGIAWGFYTLRGKKSANPLADTAGNFLRTVPMIVLAALPFVYGIHFSKRGLLFALLSGAVASGVGYTVWYSALKFHTATRAAILQLSVPILAAVGGVILLSEYVTFRLLMSGFLILGGIGLAILVRQPKKMQ